MRKPTYFPVQPKLLSRKGKMAFLANDDITQKYGGNITYYLSFMVKNQREAEILVISYYEYDKNVKLSFVLNTYSPVILKFSNRNFMI